MNYAKDITKKKFYEAKKFVEEGNWTWQMAGDLFNISLFH
jgi:hypothetical protein